MRLLHNIENSVVARGPAIVSPLSSARHEKETERSPFVYVVCALSLTLFALNKQQTECYYSIINHAMRRKAKENKDK